MKITLMLLLCFMSICSFTQAPSIQWQKSFGGSKAEQAKCVRQTTDGGYIVAGKTSSTDKDVTGNHGFDDYWIVKLKSTGELEWQKTYGGSDDDEANAIQQTADGGYIIAGRTSSLDGDVTKNQGSYDCWIVKLNNAGALQWQNSFGGNSNEAANSIQQTNDGGYIVAGYSSSKNGDVTDNHSGFGF